MTGIREGQRAHAKDKSNANKKDAANRTGDGRSRPGREMRKRGNDWVIDTFVGDVTVAKKTQAGGKLEDSEEFALISKGSTGSSGLLCETRGVASS